MRHHQKQIYYQTVACDDFSFLLHQSIVTGSTSHGHGNLEQSTNSYTTYFDLNGVKSESVREADMSSISIEYRFKSFL